LDFATRLASVAAKIREKRLAWYPEIIIDRATIDQPAHIFEETAISLEALSCPLRVNFCRFDLGTQTVNSHPIADVIQHPPYR
jgi:hypothetical protein